MKAKLGESRLKRLPKSDQIIIRVKKGKFLLTPCLGMQMTIGMDVHLVFK